MPAGINFRTPEFKVPDDPAVEKALNDISRGVGMALSARFGGRSNVTMNSSGIFETPIPDENSIRFYNGDSGSIPAYGIALIDGSQSTATKCITKTKKPDTYGCQTNWLINGPSAVATAKYGYGRTFGSGFDPDLPGLIVAYDPADGTPTAGMILGPVNGNYALKQKSQGFICQGVYDLTNNLALVTPSPITMLRGIITSGNIAAGATGTILVYYRSGSTAYTSSTYSITALNDLNVTITNGVAVRCVPEVYSGTVGWAIVQANCS